MPKGEDNIRLVFNGTSCGLNESTWSSKFWLPMSNTLTRLLSYDYQVVDLDLGEMFLNFPIHRSLDRVVGIDLTPFKRNIEEKLLVKYKNPQRLSARWTRLCFGWNQSPEQAISFYYLAEDFVRGNPKDRNNPLYWDKIVLNLIGTKTLTLHCPMCSSGIL